MARLGAQSMDAWFSLLPQDVASCMERPGESGDDEAAKVMSALPSASSGESVVKVVAEHAESFTKMGRARRIRFLAWLAGRDYPDKAAAIRRISEAAGDEGSEGADGAIGKVAPFFKEDIRALVESLGPRAARGIVDPETLAAVMGAGYEVAGELEMRSGGGI